MHTIMSCAAWVTILIISNVMVLLQSLQWDVKPLFPASKIPDDAFYPNRTVVKRKIVQYHNFFRTKVSPPASNMLKMSWHSLAAKQAQEYAERCVFLEHNAAYERTVPRLEECGQNLFIATQKTPWFFVLKSWFLEYKLFAFGAPFEDIRTIGHYTQMVWATTHKVGCGVAHCAGGPYGHFYNYVCHYCPGGNVEPVFYPYKKGKPCGDCPNDCSSESLCTNACYHKDHFSNCAELVSNPNVPNYCAEGHCNATCSCGNTKIYKNYPYEL